MKKILNLLFISLVCNSIGSVASAQIDSECLILDANGKPMDIGSLCSGQIIPKTNN